jgi:steroid 5-alpha reductase family enzyme
MGWASLAALGGIVFVVAVTFLTALRMGRHNVIDTAWGLGYLAYCEPGFVSSYLNVHQLVLER